MAKIWHNNIHLKVSFLSRRLLKEKLPFDDVIRKFGKQIISKCTCYTDSQNESIQHAFMECEKGRHIRNKFGSTLGVKNLAWPL